jgi:hypothetical protein
MASPTTPDVARGTTHSITITVNGRPVEVSGPRVTGAEIKQAAITAGVPIDMGFQLLEEESEHHTKVIGDTDTVEVHKGSTFLALAPDDNS